MDFNFTERLIYHQFQMVIRATLSLSAVPIARLHELLKFAAYNELKNQGMKKLDIATHLKCSPGYVTKLSNLSEPVATDAMAPLFVVILDNFSSNPNDCLGQAELHERVFKGDFDPDKELGGPEVAPRDDKDFERALRYLERRGILEESKPYQYQLTALGKRFVKRDLARPYLRRTQGLVALLQVASYLQAVGKPVTQIQLESARKSGELSISERDLNNTLVWCQKQHSLGNNSYLELASDGQPTAYSAPENAWLNPNDRAEDKQLTLLTLVDEMKEFSDWVCMDPPNEQVAVFSLRFRVLPDRLHKLLSAHKRHTMKLIHEAEAEAESQPNALQYSLSWIGRVITGIATVIFLSTNIGIAGASEIQAIEMADVSDQEAEIGSRVNRPPSTARVK